MDARVMARPTLKIWSYVGLGSALAAAAALLIVVLAHWPADSADNNRPVAAVHLEQVNRPVAALRLEQVSVVPVVNVIDDQIIPGGDNQPPMHRITEEKFDKTTWVDKTNGIHIETTGAPHREIILIQADVK